MTQTTENTATPLTQETPETPTALMSQTSYTTTDNAKHTGQFAAFIQGKAALTMNPKDYSARPKHTSADDKVKSGKRPPPSGDSPKQHTGKKPTTR
jgi:hypothetical protein